MSESYSTSPRTSTPTVPIRESALAALAAGISVLPPKEDGTKAPDGPWKRRQHERPTLDDIHRLYGTKGPPKRTGLGGVCGSISLNLECLEFDAQGRAYEPFKAAAAALGLADLVERIAAGYEERTPTDGIHWLYRCDVIAGNTKLAQYESDELDANGRPIVKPLIETRGEGGFVVMAPSYGKVHPSGKPYVQLRGGCATIATITPEERRALWYLARSFDESPHVEQPCKEESRVRKEYVGGGDDTISPIDDYNARASWPDILPAGWTLVYQHGDTEYWRRPGKSQGVSATINRNGTDRLFVFSTSAGFDALRPYSKFDACARLNHGGDFRATFHALSQAGYGTFKAWVWEESTWVLRTLPNPCPAGGLVRIARPGEKPPPPPKGSKGKAEATAEPSANGKGPDHAIATPTVEDEPPINRTDLGNASRLIKLFGHLLRYCPKWGSWLVWDETRWREDGSGEIFRLAKRTIRTIGAEAAAACSDEEAKAILRWALASESKARVDAMVALAWNEPGIPVQPEELNRDPYLLNVQNGTIDLTTGELRPHRQEDLITKLAPVRYDPSAQCPRFLAYLDRIMGGSQELIQFIRRALGYSLTASTGEHALFLLFGSGRNGKSTLLNIALYLLGDYATTIDVSLLVAKHHQDHPTGLTDLDGRRFVPTSEVDDGKRIAEALVKKLTGGERIKARRMRENNYEFDPTYKLFLAVNHEPEIHGTDEGIWSRIKLIPFNVFIPKGERIKDLDKTLVAEEGAGIFAWMVKGCLDWQREGLAEPKAVLDATDGYRAKMDALGNFLEERCDCPEEDHLKKVARTLASALYNIYVDWARGNGYEPVTSRDFGSEMEKRGYKLRKSNGKCWREGLRIRSDAHDRGNESVYF